MASRPKSGRTGTRRTSAGNRKPATIDLEAKEVGSQPSKAKASTAKPAATSKAKSTETKTSVAAKSPEIGRTDSSDKRTKTHSSVKETAKPSASTRNGEASAKSDGTSQNPATEKEVPVGASPESGKGGNSLVPAITGALVAVLGLGAIGQFDGARNIPLIGSLYGSGSEAPNTVSNQDFEALRNKIAELSSASDTSGQVDLVPLNEKLADLETQIKTLAEAGTDGSGSVNPEIINRIGSIEAALGEMRKELEKSGNAISTTAIEQTVAGLTSRLSKLEAGVANSAQSGEKLSQIDDQVTALSEKLDGIGAESEQNSSQLADLVAQSTDLRNTVASVKTSEKVAKAVAVNALASALENDDPLGLPISSLEALVGEMPETKRLAQLSREGIPTLNELISGLESFSNEIGNTAGASEDASLSDKFWANAQSLVTFRSTGPRDGNDPTAILSRVKAFIEAGNLTEAGNEWATLPEVLQEKGKGWSKKLAVRTEAQALQHEISSKLALQAG
ncbi:MAG: hypothetical protein ACR2O3_02800 [Rhizobiaceae bacterium]